jgi:hypothetical protein
MPPSLLKYLLNTCIPIILLILTTSDVNGEQAKRDQIGTVLGKPVYRDQIATEKGLTAELFRIFSIEGIANQYREKHLAEITPTEDEIEAARAFFDGKHAERIKDKEAGLRSRLAEIISQRQAGTTAKEDEKRLKLEQMNIESQLAVPGRSFATYMLSHWKFQKHLYDNYGGGRLLWQQAGIEAYDANRKWLECLEAAGEFSISDSELRKKFYNYWTSQDGSSFLSGDKKAIHDFLNPEWQHNK